MANPKFNLPIKNQGKIQMSFKELIGKKMSKPVKFMGSDVSISKLSVAEVMNIQELAKNTVGDEQEGFGILKTVIRSSVEGAADITDEDFSGFPMDELSRLSNEIMKFSGIGQEATAAGK